MMEVSEGLELLNFFLVFISTSGFILICLLLEKIIYPLITFPHIDTFPAERILSPILKKRSTSSNGTNRIINNSGQLQVYPAHPSIKVNYSNVRSPEKRQQSVCLSFFPQFSNWPFFYIIVFLAGPVMTAALLYTTVSANFEDMIFLSFKNLTESEGIAAEVVLEQAENLIFAANMALWMGSFYLALVPLAILMGTISGVATDFVHGLLPLSFHNSVEFELCCFSAGFFMCGMAFGALGYSLDADEFPAELYFLSICCSLLNLSLLSFKGYKGLIILLNFIFLDILVSYKVLWKLLHWGCYGAAIYFISLLNMASAIFLAASFCFFGLFPKIIDVLVAGDFVFALFNSMEQNHRLSWTEAASEREFSTVLREVQVRIPSRRDYGSIGQKLQIWTFSCRTMLSLEDVFIAGRKSSAHNSRGMIWTLKKTTKQQDAQIFFSFIFSYSTIGCFFRILYLIASTPLWLFSAVVDFSLSLLTRSSVERFCSLEPGKKTLMLISLPRGHSLRRVYQQPNKETDLKQACFFVDSPGFDSGLAHFSHVCSKNEFQCATFIFNCDDLESVIRSVYCVITEAPSEYWTTNYKLGEKSGLNVVWVVNKSKIRGSYFKDYIPRMVEFAVDVCLQRNDDESTEKVVTKSDRNTILNKIAPNFLRRIPCPSRLLGKAHLQKGGCEISFCSIGSASLAYSVRDMKRKCNDRHISSYETIFEKSVENLPQNKNM